MKTTTISRFAQAALLIIFMLAKSTVYSQTLPDSTDYNYAAFRFPDIDRKALNAQFGLFGTASRFEQRQTTLPSDNRQSTFANNLNLSYSRFRNTEKLQALRLVSFGHSFSSSRTRSDVSLNRNTQFNVGLGINDLHRHYYKPQRFWAYQLLVATTFQKSSQRRDNPIFTQKSWEFDLNASLPLKIGKGRIEPIDDVFIAKFMMDDLMENGILNADLSQEQLFSLGQVMAAARNQRIFDGRRQRIYELTQLDNWFKENGLTESKSDMLYFTTVADNWLFSFRNVRSAGERYAVGAAPFALFNHFRDFAPGISKGHFGISVFGEYDNERPINQFWQVEKRARAGVEYLNNPVDANDGLYNEWLRPFAEASLGYGYFPNSRTIVLADASLRYEYYIGADNNVFDFDYHVIQPEIRLEATYFVNYQFRITGALNGSYFWSSDNADGAVFPSFELPFSINSGNRGFNFSSNVSLLYSFF
ncbi:MAG: hypothetical protein ACKV1O_17980 [Saprospiraceae bacterium]